jgi:hypothetical protein
MGCTISNIKCKCLKKMLLLPLKYFGNIFVTVEIYFGGYCMRREAVKPFRFLLPPYSLIATCNNVQNCTFRDCSGTFLAYCKCREAVKQFMFMLFLLIGTCNSVQNCNFHDCIRHFVAYCRCREAVKLFRFLMSPYSLLETCYNVQNCNFRGRTGTFFTLL